MRDFRDAKAMAKTLREALRAWGATLTHAQSLELTARQFGFDNWNILAAKIGGPRRPPGQVRLAPAVPIIRIFDVAKAKEFYVDFLGFRIEWEHRRAPEAPLYAQINRSDLILHLSEHHGDASPGATVYVEASGIQALHAELLAKDYPYLRPGLEQTDYGHQSMEVLDPFGNRLRFSQPQAERPDRATMGYSRP